MGATTWLIILYILLIGLTVFAFAKKKRAAGIIMIAVMVTGAVILGYLWFTSPM